MGLVSDLPLEIARKSFKIAAKIGNDERKEYDVFSGRICWSVDRYYWWEEFRHIGKCLAYNSVHAMTTAKHQFPQHLRIAVMAAAHPLSPSSQAVRAANLASMALNYAKGDR